MDKVTVRGSKTSKDLIEKLNSKIDKLIDQLSDIQDKL